jgi:LacI family transcriptional regulator
MSVTQKQIADRLNISPSLVGKALNGHPEVAEKTRLRVETVAREMGYNVNANSAARALIAKRHGLKIRKGIMAVTFASLELASPRQTPFFAPIIGGLEAEAAERGIELYFCMLRQNELPVLVREKEVDGVILVGGVATCPPVVSQIEQLGIPALTVHWRCNGARSVEPDDRDGGRQATRHLLEQGHRRIGYIGVEKYKNSFFPDPQAVGHVSRLASLQRRQGYLDAMSEYGIEVPPEWIEDTLPLRTLSEAYCPGCGNCASCSGWSALAARNKSSHQKSAGADGYPFTALVCHNDSVAMGTVIQARKHGFAVPGDISVIGFDQLSAEFKFVPELTSVNFSRYEMGRRAIRLMSEAVNETLADKSPQPKPFDLQETEHWHRVLPVELVVADSTRSLLPAELITS